MSQKEFFKVVCVDDNDPFEYRVLTEANRGSLTEIHEFVQNEFNKYKGAKWILLPFVCNN